MPLIMPRRKFKKPNKSKTLKELSRVHRQYHIINIAIAGVIACILLYSGIFPYQGNHFPIHSAYSQITASTGMSRAFSAIMQADLGAAAGFNAYAIRIFAFFLIQLLLRLIISAAMFNKRFSINKLLVVDIFISVFLFLWAFIPLIRAQIQLLT